MRQFLEVAGLLLSQAEISMLLENCPLFSGAGAEFLLVLTGMDGASRAEFSSGQVVYSPKEFRRCLGVVLSGQLQVSKETLFMSTLDPGDLFGAASLYGDAPEFASTITARRVSWCLMLEQELVDRLLAERRDLRENYLRYLTERIRFLSGRLRTLSQPGADGKLARYLLSSGQVSLTCSATQLSRRLNVSRASLYRAFAALESAGLIARSGKTIRIADPGALELV